MTTPLPTAKPEDVGLSSPALARLSGALQQRIDSGHIPGAVVLIARHGKVAFHEAFGLRDPVSKTPMQTDAIFRIYSMTKPIVSVATMMLAEQGKVLLNDPVSRHLPEFAKTKVGVAQNETLKLVSPDRDMTVQDLLRHTSGLTYEFRGTTPVHKAYQDSKIARLRQKNEDQVATLASLPLLHQPATQWEYSRSTDVLGRLVEVLSGQTLGAFLKANVQQPLGMADAGFWVPQTQQGRIAEPFPRDPETGVDVAPLDVTREALFESGGGGMVATAMDYARFLQMLLNGGQLDGARLLGRKTIEWMTSDHLGDIPAPPEMVPPGYGFGLGFAVRKAAGMGPFAGSVGDYYWSGAAGTLFWVDPVERLFAILMIQAPGQRQHYRPLFRDMVYTAVLD